MKKKMISWVETIKSLDLVYYYVLAAAGIICAYISVFSYGYHLYQFFLALPCILLYGTLLERRKVWRCRKSLVLPVLMVLWFLFLRLKHGSESSRMYNLGLFAAIYLFAFPLASLLRDGEQKKALKIFAGAYLAGAAALTVAALSLLLGRVPAFLSGDICWNGGRLQAFWHPNLAACIWMIGTVFCTAFLSQVKSRWSKAGLCVLLVMMLAAMVLTNCRTAMLLTGGYLGATLFFAVIKHRKKWFIPAVVTVIVLAVVLLALAGYLGDQQQPVQPATVGQGTLINDLGTLNSRTHIWNAGFDAIDDDPTILVWGVYNPGKYLTENGYFPIAHMHNAWMECLLGMGLPGLLIAMLFTLITVWNCLIILLKHYQDDWKRNVALLTLCLLAAAMLEPYLFYTLTDYHPFNLLFFLCAGYLACWQEEDNRNILTAVCGRRFPGKK